MLSLSVRLVATPPRGGRLPHSPPWNSSSLFWNGIPSSSSSPRLTTLHATTSPSRHSIRTYLFLPSTLHDALQLLRSRWQESSTRRKRLAVKLSARWHDRLRLLLNRLPPPPSRTTLPWRRRLLTHCHAKQRVFSARRMEIGPFRDPRLLLFEWQRWSRWKTRAERKRRQWREWWGRRLRGATWKSVVLTEPTERSWFDAEGFPLASREEETGRFVNPWLSRSANGENGLVKFLRWKLGGAGKRWRRELEDKVAQERKGSTSVAKSPYREGTRRFTSAEAFVDFSDRDAIRLTWLGHSTTLVSLPGNFTILTDPHFSNYAGPMRRNDPPPVGVMELPPLDCVLISHDHMDHLDYWSILELIDSNKVQFWIVPLGIKQWLVDKAGVSPEDIVELEWWEGVRITKDGGHGSSHSHASPVVDEIVRAFHTSNGQQKNTHPRRREGKNEMVITCAPAQHWCSRTPFDRNRRLWCSWAVHTTPSVAPQTHSFYFAGDTGLPPEFPLHHQIGDRLGPFDLAAIPIGAYEPRWFMRESHCDPAEAVAIHQAIRSSRSVAIHFDTFNLADEPQAEPPRFLVQEVDRVNEEIGRLAAEVVAVAGEVGAAVTRTESSVGVGTANGNIDISLREEANVEKPLEAMEKLMGILPPLVDFAVIPQGHCIESSPKR